MWTSLTSLEILLGIGVALLATLELRGVLAARREGRSSNVSRIVTHGAMLLLLVLYGFFALSFYPLETSKAGIVSYGTPVVNWTYVVLGVLVTLIAGWESLALMRARHLGLTKNLSRLVSHTVMLVMLLAMMGLSTQKWDHYLDRLEVTYSQDIPGAASIAG